MYQPSDILLILVYQPSYILVYQPSDILVYQPSNILVHKPSNILVYQPSDILVYQPSDILQKEVLATGIEWVQTSLSTSLWSILDHPPLINQSIAGIHIHPMILNYLGYL